MYSRINSRKSPASGAGNITGPWPTSQFGKVRKVTCAQIGRVSAIVVVEVPVFICSHSSWNNVTEVRGSLRFERFAQKVVMQNDGDFVDVILLYWLLTVTPLLYLTAVQHAVLST